MIFFSKIALSKNTNEIFKGIVTDFASRWCKWKFICETKY